VMYDELAKTLISATQFDYADLVQVQEENVKMLGDLGKMMILNLYKRHRIYKKDIG
jgi:hypothetical protein